MSIQFKFRSCRSFDSVDTDGRPSISLRELREKIIRYKKLNTCHDFDLVFSDPLSVEAYNDENFQIASGSSVIVKRVPAGTVPSAAKFQCQKLGSRDLSQAIERGSNQSKLATKLPEPKTVDVPTLQKVVSSNFPAVPNSFLPVELKCPLCNTFFKDAVMIPCCQYSFCEKCIRLALLEKAMCPKCVCIRCRVEDLLPNLSLRKAIEHFLESQMLDTGSENALRKYAPDGESGIQMKDVPCVIVMQREPEMPHSPTATGKGSNQVMEESLYDSLTRKKSLSWTMQQMDGGRGRYANHWNCQGERKPLNLLHSHVQNEGNSMLTGGFPRYPSSPYWSCNMYGYVGNVPFNAFMVPPTPYDPPYMRYMHGSMASPGGIMRMGGMALPSGNRDDLTLNQYEYMGLPLAEDKRRIQYENLGRGQYCQAESNSVTDGFPSSSDRRRRESHQHHSWNSRKRHKCDSALDHYQVSDRKRGVICHVRGSHQKHHPSSALEPNSHVYQKARSKERGLGHDAKDSRHHARHSTNEVRDNKKRMSSGSYENCIDGYHHKRKRVH